VQRLKKNCSKESRRTQALNDRIEISGARLWQTGSPWATHIMMSLWTTKVCDSTSLSALTCEETLARISFYMTAESMQASTSLLKPLITPLTIPKTLLVVILDWAQPWLFLRQLRDWIRLVQSLLHSLGDECQSAMEKVMEEWRNQSRQSTGVDGKTAEGLKEVLLPPGPGELDEPLGLPLCIVCRGTDNMERLEAEYGWREEDFDFVLQVLRTVSLKHGAALIYTAPSAPGSLRNLLLSCLGIPMPRSTPLKANSIDREKVLILPGWDSWGKIRILRDNFEIEKTSECWAADIADPNGSVEHSGGTVAAYEDTVSNPHSTTTPTADRVNQVDGPEVTVTPHQEFLGHMLELLEKEKSKAKAAPSLHGARSTSHEARTASTPGASEDKAADDGALTEQIGPVQFNMGGIQMDVEEGLQRLKVSVAARVPGRQADARFQEHQSREADEPETPRTGSPEEQRPEELSAFFAGLMTRGASSSANSPRASGS
jgi:dynein light intermediate chain 1